jgi:hypothetical protein
VTSPDVNQPGDERDVLPDTRAPQHLRVGLLIRADSIQVRSIWLVDAPATRSLVIGHPILVRIDVASRLAAVELIADPRISRSTMKPGAGHHVGVYDEGVGHVSVPFTTPTDLLSVRIRLTDLAGGPAAPSDAAGLARLFSGPSGAVRQVHELTTKDLQESKDWTPVAEAVGIPHDRRPGG